ncbi:uncharacterized protein LOC142236165 [Haematobia irritans]|uniref:uncharacterized protein LOC142236165 n=1 Tax=Haematobia irritans TaxID=7368 RepID=UPI003F4FA950
MKRICLSSIDNGKENNDKALCQCSHEVLKQFDAKFFEMQGKFSEMTCEIRELKSIIQTQNEAIMTALSVQKVVTESLVRQEKNNAAIKNVFPINTLEELKTLNDVIMDENQQVYASYYFSLLLLFYK